MKQIGSPYDRRNASRKPVQFAAWIEATQREPLACVVLDMTLKGARLRAPDVALPNEFTLLLEPNSSLRRRCKVAWRKGFTLGLEFVEASPDEQPRHSDVATGSAKK
jgi:hypothetical protein